MQPPSKHVITVLAALVLVVLVNITAPIFNKIANNHNPFVQQVFSQDDLSCEELNDLRTNYTACCEYPLFVVWQWQHDECSEQCQYSYFKDCCITQCCFRLLGVLSIIRDDQGSLLFVDINRDALISSFLLSVGNSTLWAPIVSATVYKCYQELWGTHVKEEVCSFIPGSFYPIVSCSYTENFLKCPVWNPQQINECNFTLEYVEKCW